jgi:hypothetical protein
MNIVGLDALVFGVDDIEACSQYLRDYGLHDAGNGRFEALDGTAVELRASSDPRCRPPPPPAAAAQDGDARGRRRHAGRHRHRTGPRPRRRRGADGSLESVDDFGFALGFHVCRAQAAAAAGRTVQCAGLAHPARGQPAGCAAAGRCHPTAHAVAHRLLRARHGAAEAFYVQRLGFRVTDRFTGVGPFLQPAGTLDHHTHFLIPAPPHMQGVEHFTFHFGGPTEVLRNGWRFVQQGYQAFWGPGRHLMGSNWFWYFNSPLACHVEMDADMDLHDASWQPRSMPLAADNSQAFLLRHRDKWMPGPGTPAAGDYA